jgi:hypothetical protein
MLTSVLTPWRFGTNGGGRAPEGAARRAMPLAYLNSDRIDWLFWLAMDKA